MSDQAVPGPGQSADQFHHISLTETQLKALVAEGVNDAFTRIGIDSSNVIEMQKDFQHLRDWRKATDSIRHKGILTMVGILVTGTCAALFMGLKQMFQQ